MNFVFFVHSLISDWNNGNAHFQRGIIRELVGRGHTVRAFEPFKAWSRENLVRESGNTAESDFLRAFPMLKSERYHPQTVDLDRLLDGADIVIVHEWNDSGFIQRIGRHHESANYRLLFHDTHHRMASALLAGNAPDFSGYDGALLFGESLREIYECHSSIPHLWVWHEAADINLFYPQPNQRRGLPLDVVWIGNWGDGERSAELEAYCFGPIFRLGLKAEAYGVRYPPAVRTKLARLGINYRGWISNYQIPKVFSSARVTIHVPRNPYVNELMGIPTIRIFEALACGIPLVSAPWTDSEGLFRKGTDYLMARDTKEMEELLRNVVTEPELAGRLAQHGLQRIRSQHTCMHRADELLAIASELGIEDDSGLVLQNREFNHV